MLWFTGAFEVVGLDPDSARRLAGRLDDAGGALDAQSIRIQSLLDRTGIPCTAPATIRSVGRTCGETAYDLRRRAGLVRAPVLDASAPGWQGEPGFTGREPGSSCGQVSVLPEEPVQPSPWAALGSGGLIAGLRPGPWVTPVGPGRTAPWITPGITTSPGGQPGVGGPDIVMSAGPTQPCETAPFDKASGEESSAVDQLDDDCLVAPEGKCDNFALTLPCDEIPEILRRVATVIERIEGFQLLDLTTSVCEGEATASIYYWKHKETGGSALA